MKVSEINKYIKKHLQDSLFDYQVEKGFIFKTESDFFLKGYDFESTGDGEYDLAVWCFIQPLFVKSDCLYYNFGNRLKYKKKVNILQSKELEWWDASKEKLDESFQSILHSIKTTGEEYLNQFKTVQNFYSKFKNKARGDIRVYEAIAYSAILCEEQSVQDKMLRGLLKEAENERDADWVHQIKSDAALLLSTTNTEDRIKVLKQWANETIGQLKLSKLKPFTL